MGKQTGWVIAATEGATVDGRTITAAWINDMAEQYSVDEYTALIWPEHFRSTWGPFEGKNWGTVDEVKAAKYKGKLRLYVKLTANSYLLEANKDGQKLFMSVEPNIDYKGTGRAYLQGIAVTDSPASSGTTRLKFSMGDNHTEHEYSQLEELLAIDFITTQTNESDAQLQSGLFTVISDYFKKFTAPDLAPEIEEDPMNKEQFAAFMAQFETFGAAMTGLSEKLDNFSVNGAAPAEQEPVEEKQPASDTGMTAEQFSKIETMMTGFSEKLGDMETQFKKLSQEAPNQEPDPAGGSEAFSVV